MNILLYSSAFPPHGGGVGSYFMNMALALTSCGHRVVVATCRVKGLPEEDHINGIRIFRLYNLSEAGTSGVLTKIQDVIERQSIHIVEGADFLGDCATLLHHSDRPPVIIKLHSCNILDVLYESQILKWWQRMTIRAALLRNWRLTRREKFSICNADILLAPTQRIFNELSRQGIPIVQKQTVVPNPIKVIEGQLGKESPRPTVLMVCRLDVGKGIQFIPHIVRGLAQKYPDVILEIAGGDSYARGLGSLQQWLLRQLGELKKYVKFLGHLQAPLLEQAYTRAWVVMIPSRWDNFPTVLLEAMKYGKAVVASPHGGMPEMLANTLCSTYPPESESFVGAINRLLEDATLRRTAGESLRKKARMCYSPEKVVEQYINALSPLLE